MDSLEEAFINLSYEDKKKVKECCRDASMGYYNWSLRFASAKLALVILGAKCVTDSKANRSTLWKMPCGCSYELDFAKTSRFDICEKHPSSKKTLKVLFHFIKNLFEYLLIFVIWVSTIVTIITIVNFFSKCNKQNIINIELLYIGAGTTAVILRKILYKKNN